MHTKCSSTELFCRLQVDAKPQVHERDRGSSENLWVVSQSVCWFRRPQVRKDHADANFWNPPRIGPQNQNTGSLCWRGLMGPFCHREVWAGEDPLESLSREAVVIIIGL